MTTSAGRDAGLRQGPNPAAFGFCSGAVVAAIMALGVFGVNLIVSASQPAGTLDPGLALGDLAALLFAAVFTGGLFGLMSGLVLTEHHPQSAERVASVVYPLAPVALLIVLGALFLSYFLSS